jgi:hypothetical protein
MLTILSSVSWISAVLEVAHKNPIGKLSNVALKVPSRLKRAGARFCSKSDASDNRA